MHTNHRDRLRAKALENIDALNDYELIELILFSAKPRVNTNDTAHLLLDTFGIIARIMSATPKALAEVDGVGPQTAAHIATLSKIIERYNAIKDSEQPKVFSFADFKPKLISLFKPCKEEVFLCYFLNKQLQVVGRRVVCDHNPSSVTLKLEEFAKQVVLNKPHAAVIAHNHLSGICQPTPNDDSATERLAILLELNGVQLVDHIIVTENNAYSYFHDGRLDQIKNKIKNIL